MRKSGEIVCVSEKTGGSSLWFYMIQQGGSFDKKKIKFPCPHDVHSLHWLFIQVMWREYLAISCYKCKDIKLSDLDTMKLTTAYSDEQEMHRMSKGWHKMYVHVPSGFLELDCTSTKFTKIRQIETQRGEMKYCTDLCYVPPPHNLIVGINSTINWWLVELPMWLTDGFSVTFFGRWKGQCAYTLMLIPVWLTCGNRTQ